MTNNFLNLRVFLHESNNNLACLGMWAMVCVLILLLTVNSMATDIGVASKITGSGSFHSKNNTYQSQDIVFSNIDLTAANDSFSISDDQEQSNTEPAITSGPYSYPNPVRFTESSAHIGYGLNQNTDITIKLFSVSGRKIWESQFPMGSNGGSGSAYNKVEISPETLGFELPSGIYLFTVHDTETDEILGKEKIGVKP